VLRFYSFFLYFFLLSSFSLFADDFTTNPLSAKDIVQGVRSLCDTPSGLAISHYRHPSYDDISFVYDSAVAALILYYGGEQAAARRITDYFDALIKDAADKPADEYDYSGIYGGIKAAAINGKYVLGIVNCLDNRIYKIPGRARLEFFVTPGPASFLIYSFLHIDKDKYLESAVCLGELLLAMKQTDGAVIDGDRSRRFHSEPCGDVYAAFKMLYSVTGDERWRSAAEKVANWLKNNIYDQNEHTVWQGVWDGRVNKVFAEDVFAWGIAAGIWDGLDANEIFAMNEKLLERFLVHVDMLLPDIGRQSLYLVDFTDPLDEKTILVRKGKHPTGSVEWSGGAVLALKRSAVRLYKARHYSQAGKLKACAMLLEDSCLRSFYHAPGVSGAITFYATAQGVEVGPFGAINESTVEGWQTPYFYLDNKDERQGGSVVGAWPLLPYLKINPFIIDDEDLKDYDKVTVVDDDRAYAKEIFEKFTQNKNYKENLPKEAIGKHTIVVEPQEYNRRMWDAYKKNDFVLMREWALKVIAEKDWIKLAAKENEDKLKRYGGLVEYEWGRVYDDNSSPEHRKILAYPVLNELGAAYWALIVASYELHNYDDIPGYFKKMVDEALLHQIPAVVDEKVLEPLIKGYWSAVAQFCRPVYPTARDREINRILKEKLGNDYLDKIYSCLGLH